MRRLDYQIVSRAMSDVRPRPGDDDATFSQWEQCCDALADAFTEQTPAFERNRFLKDCGYPPPPPGV